MAEASCSARRRTALDLSLERTTVRAISLLMRPNGTASALASETDSYGRGSHGVNTVSPKPPNAGSLPVLDKRLESLKHARAHKGVRVAQALLQRVKEAARLCVFGGAGGRRAFTVAIARGGRRCRRVRGLAFVLLGSGLLAGPHSVADQVAECLDHRHTNDVRLHWTAVTTQGAFSG